MLQLYPELQGSQEFHPWKSSLSGKFCKLSPLHSCCSHTHALSHSLTYKDRHSILQSLAPLFPNQRPKPNPTPNVALGGSVPIQPLADRTKSAAEGWLGSSRRGSGLARECMAADTTRPAASDSLSLTLSFCLHPFIYLLSFYPFISTPFLFPSLPPSAFSCLTV